MPVIINPTITDAGIAAAAQANANQLQVHITHVAIGASGYTPNGAETAMVDRRETVSISSGVVNSGGALTVSVLFPSYSGSPYDAREIGFYIGDPDAGGVLFAVYSNPAAAGFVYRSSLDFIAQFTLGLTRVPVGSVSVTIDPQAAVLHALIEDHKDDADPHPGYVQDDELIGSLAAFAVETPPAKWLVANGAALSRTTYSKLFNRIGTRFGAGNGSTTFNLPNATDRMLIGAGPTFQFATSGGSKDAIVVEHSHTAGIAPDHAHGVNLQQLNSNSDVGYGRIATGGASPEGVIPNISTDGGGAHGHTISTVGSSGVGANMPPFLSSLICIKYE